ncbi:hypothetical protein ACPCG0_13970 [Propionibacteriaceae bacterium Y1923]
MARILITGMSGAGKSTLLAELAARGHLTVDTDYDGWEQISDLLAEHGDLVVSGTAENQGQFYDRFEHVILLSAPVETLIERVATRTNNPYGRTPEQQDEIRRYVREVEPLLRRGASLELDGRRPVRELADVVESLSVDEDAMHYVDHEPGAWFLVEHDDALYLDARYTYSALIDDSALIRLTDRERHDYLARGRDSIGELAAAVHESAPYRPTSVFHERDLYRSPEGRRWRQRVEMAIADHAWIRRQNSALFPPEARRQAP